MDGLERGDPRRLGPFRILARLAVGGTATVYLGRSRGGRAVAVKVLHREHARRPAARARFRDEVLIATAAGGPHAPSVLDADAAAAIPWMALEFLPSATLRDAVEHTGPLPDACLRHIAAGTAEALGALHRAGIAHLDVTPANILLTSAGPRLIDFGIAARGRSSTADGTPGFMAPEQVAADAGPESDVFSLGATLAFATEPDGELRALIDECRDPDPTARPTAAELTRRIAALTSAASQPGDTELPTGVREVIAGRQLAAADAPVPPWTPTRRQLLLGVGVVVPSATGALVAALAQDTGRGPSPGASRGATPSAAPPLSPSMSPSPATPPSELRFVVTGDGPLTDLTYWVNGRHTTLPEVARTWKKTVVLPAGTDSVDYRLRFTVHRGAVEMRVYVNDVEIQEGKDPSVVPQELTTYPFESGLAGSADTTNPVPAPHFTPPAIHVPPIPSFSPPAIPTFPAPHFTLPSFPAR
ncbi:hypothetical protein SRB5_25980 [Streptomyces sp. RB5]|uniref:Protein kinase domain-containing protein n=1 Tax=Streptomyces smaragdinus TaxID=2585196 RepID=A0A7K0CIB1_9ACTN|nr:serine/threonine-protein kinase [Streptomyces smaragdinus]MQY12464.1 hypothetical protein [Streptomyces smaragdinus]